MRSLDARTRSAAQGMTGSAKYPSLSAAIFAVVTLISFSLANRAAAEDYVPTLQALHDAGETIPGVTPETVYPESAYEVTEVTDPAKIEAGEYDFKYYLGLDESKNPIFKYYNWALKTAAIAQDSLENIHILPENEIPMVDGQIVCDAAHNCFAVAHGVDESGAPIYQYFGYDIKAGVTPVTTRATTEEEVKNTQPFVGVYDTYSAIMLGDANEIDIIARDFIINHVNTQGGAIYNGGTIESLIGDFIGNYAKSTSGNAYGGAIYNANTITTLIGDFIGNYALSSSSYAQGGAIYNQAVWNGSEYVGGTITTLTGDFIGNYALSSSNYARGGAIYNQGSSAKISTVTGDFIGNYAEGSYEARGGAIYNSGGTIGTLTGDFIGNYAEATSNNAAGGAIFNDSYSTITTIIGDFIGNYVNSISRIALGGAIYNYGGTIATLISNFNNNYVKSTSNNAIGGAIYNTGTITTLTGDFIGNYVEWTGTSMSYSTVLGGAIYNGENSKITTLTGNFSSNYAQATLYATKGGVIYNTGTITTLTGDFSGNYAKSTSSAAQGGAIHNYGTNVKIEAITGDLIGNYALSSSSYAYGGAIYNASSVITTLTGYFISNYAQGYNSAKGGAIYNYGGTITTLTGDFTDNYAQSTLGSVYGGAIYNTGTIGFKADAGDASDECEDDILFQGNYIQLGTNAKQYEAIYNQGSSAVITFNSENGGSYTFYDYINGDGNGTINFKLYGNTGQLNLYNNIQNQKEVNFTQEWLGGLWNMDMRSSHNTETSTPYNYIQAQKITVGQDIWGDYVLNAQIDINFNSKQFDYFSSSGNAGSGIITISGLNVIGGNPSISGNYKLRVLQSGTSNLQLALTDAVANQLYNYGEFYMWRQGGGSWTDPVAQHTNWQDEYNWHEQYDDLYGHLGLTTYSTTNDSIGLVETRRESTSNSGKIDTLAAVARADLDGRTFDFDSANDVYHFDTDYTGWIGELGEGSFTINGVADSEGNRSTIDLSDVGEGMYVYSYSPLNIYNTKMQNNHNSWMLVYNDGGTINNIVNSEFVGFGDSGSSDAVIHNFDGTINNISGTTFGGYGEDDWNYRGIYNNEDGTINYLGADFINNRAPGRSNGKKGTYYYEGGAIYNSGEISNISGDFIGNTASKLNDDNYYTYAYGGAIYNGSTIQNINGSFTGNKAEAVGMTRGWSYGGAIWNNGTIGDITGEFSGNTATATSENSYAEAHGGAIWNGGTITSISGDFSNNTATTTSENSNAGAYGGAIRNDWGSTITSITGDFSNNTATGNSVANALGGAIYNEYGTIESLIGDFSANSAVATSDSEDSYAKGGAIYQYSGSNINTISGSFTGNYAKALNGTAKGGAIYNSVTDEGDSTITMVADGNETGGLKSNILFQGNYVEDKDGKRYEAIYNGEYWDGEDYGNVATLNFESRNGGAYTFYDYINGDDDYTGVINFTGDGTGKLNLRGNAGIMRQGQVNINSSYAISTEDGEINDNIVIENLNVNAASTLKLDVDLSGSGAIDYINLNGTEVNGYENLSLIGLTILRDFDHGVNALYGLEYASDMLTNPETIVVQTSKGSYQVVNTGYSIDINKMSKSGGYVAYLKDEERADYYSFTEDEYSDYFDNPVEDLDGKVNLDIRGNGHTLMGDLDGRALNLAQGQYANIDNLRIKNFVREVGTENGAALYNAKGEMWVHSPEISGNVSRVVNTPTTDESDPAYVNATVNGGAIYNTGTMGIYADIINGNGLEVYNDIYPGGNWNARGGAIYNQNANFYLGGYNLPRFVATGNYAKAYTNTNDEGKSTATANGGFMYLVQSADGLDGNWMVNYAKAEAWYADANAAGGAIYHGNGNLYDINGQFYGNYAEALVHTESYKADPEDPEDVSKLRRKATASANGGAMNTAKNIEGVHADFNSNYAYAHSDKVGQGLAKASGGAWNITGGTVGLIDGDFSSNHASAETEGIAHIGGEDAATGTATALGGAIAISGATTVSEIKGSTFEDNYAYAYSPNKPATAQGGALYLQGNNKKQNIALMEDVTFRNNGANSNGEVGTGKTHTYGGAIYNNSTIKQMRNVTFEGNYAVDGGNDNNAYGGAIFNSNTGVIGYKANEDEGEEQEWLTATFKNNSAYYGGAIYNEGISKQGYIYYLDGIFEGNNAEYGGAIYNSGQIVGLKGEFKNNKVGYWHGDGNGGAIYNTKNLSIVDSLFEGNEAYYDEDEGTEGGIAGAIYSTGTLSIANSIFRNNYGQVDYGTLYQNSYSTLTISNSQFLENRSGCDHIGLLNTRATITDTLFKDNVEGDNVLYIVGDAEYLYGKTNIIGSTFNGNNNVILNGGIYAELNLINSDIVDNDGYAIRNETWSDPYIAADGLILTDYKIDTETYIDTDGDGEPDTSLYDAMMGLLTSNEFNFKEEWAEELLSRADAGEEVTLLHDRQNVDEDRYNELIDTINYYGGEAKKTYKLNTATVTLTADDYDMQISGNGGAIYNAANAIMNFNAMNGGTLTIDDAVMNDSGTWYVDANGELHKTGILVNTTENGEVTFNGEINKNDDGDMYVSGDGTGNVVLNNNAYQHIFLENGGKLTLGADDGYYDGIQAAEDTDTDAVLSMQNGKINHATIDELDFYQSNYWDYQLDVDLANEVADYMELNDWDWLDYGNALKVSSINLLSDMAEDTESVVTPFINALPDDYKNVLDPSMTKLYTTKYLYDVSLTDGTKSLLFNKIGKISGFAAAVGDIPPSSDGYRTYSATDDDEVKGWYSDQMEGVSLIANGNGKKIYTENDLHGVIMEGGAGQYLELNNIAEFSGFHQALYVGSGNEANINGVTFKGNVIEDGDALGSGQFQGAAIDNQGYISNLTANFVENSIDVTEAENIYAAALGNDGNIDAIEATFTGNSIKYDGDNSVYVGGGIYGNYGNVESIKADFVENTIELRSGDNININSGIASGTADEVEAMNFYRNKVEAYADGNVNISGGMIDYFDGSEFVGDFTDNMVKATAADGYIDVRGGIAYDERDGSYLSMDSDFVGNTVEVEGKTADINGGIIYTPNTELQLDGKFENNKVTATANGGDAGIAGGMIYNDYRKAEDVSIVITGWEDQYQMIQNDSRDEDGFRALAIARANKDGFSAEYITQGGNKLYQMLKKYKDTGSVVMNNYIKCNNCSADEMATTLNYYIDAFRDLGGAIEIAEDGRATLTNLDGKHNAFFVGIMYGYIDRNGVISYESGLTSDEQIEGLVDCLNSGHCVLPRADYESERGDVEEWAVQYEEEASYYSGISLANVDFVDNEVIANGTDGAYVELTGGLVANTGIIDEISGNYTGNKITVISENDNGNLDGGLIKNSVGAEIGLISGKFNNNQIIANGAQVSGGVISLEGKIDEISDAEFNNNKVMVIAGGDANVSGGVIGNFTEIGEISNAEFKNNKVTVEAEGIATAKGGAIYTNSNIDRITNTDFVNNVIEVSGAEGSTAKGGAIYAEHNGVQIFADNYDMKISGNKTIVNGEETNNAIYMNGGQLNFAAENGGTITIDDEIDGENDYEVDFFGDDGQIAVNNYVKNADYAEVGGNVTFDKGEYIGIRDFAIVDANSNVTINDLGSHDLHFDKLVVADNSTINIGNVNADLAKETMGKLHADEYGHIGKGAKVNVNGLTLLSDAKKAHTEINFTDGDLRSVVSSKVKETAYSPIYKYQVAYDAKTGNFTFDRSESPKPDPEDLNPAIEATKVAQHSGAFIQASLIYEKVMDIITRNTSMADGLSSGDMPNRKVWVRTFGGRENVDLRHGLDNIHNDIQGVLGGVDSDEIATALGYSWRYGVYGAYLTGKQKYDGNRIRNKGGNIGATAVAYKGDFYSGLTANVGYRENEANTMYGKDKFDLFMGGIASKTGYSIKLSKDGKLTLEPNLLLSYTMIETENYTNAAGVKLKNDLVHVFEISPGLKVRKAYEEGFTLYALASYNIDYIEGGEVKANDLVLPSLSVKPYVEYGIGVEKDWNEEEWNPIDLITYAQIVRRDGGREGWSINAGAKLGF